MRTSPSLTLALAAATLLGATAIVGCASEIEDDATTESEDFVSGKPLLRLTDAQRREMVSKKATCPFVGTALVIGVTSWDVYDACQTLKELNEVNFEFAYAPEDHETVCGTKVPSRSEIVAQVKGNWREAYRMAADALSHAGERVPTTPPDPSWQDVKDTVCPVIGSPRILCQ